MRRISLITGLILACLPLIAHAQGELQRHSQLGVTFSYGPQGATVETVADKTAAGGIGLQVGDVITDVDQMPMNNDAQVTEMTRRLRAGTQVAIDIVRGGQKQTLNATLPAAPQENLSPAVNTLYDSVKVPAGYRVRVILTRPKKAEGKKLPVVFVTGWMSCDAPEYPGTTLDGFGQLLRDVITKSGLATVRVEKPGTGDSEGPACGAVDFNEELAAYKAAFAAMSNYSFIDTNRIVMLGLSSGGGFAPLVAGDTQVTGYVITGGWGRTWYEHMLDLERRRLSLSGKSPGDVSAAMGGFAQFYDGFLLQGMTPGDVIKAHPELSSLWYDADDGQYGRPAAYFQQLQALNLGKAWAQVSAPVLVMAGEYDWIMNLEDQQAIVDAVNATHPGKATFEVLPKTDHGLQVYKSAAAAFNDKKSGKYDGTASKDALKFLKKYGAGSRWHF